MRRAWTAEEDARMRELAADGRSWASIGAELGRSGGACAERARKVGIAKPRAAQKDAWTAEEDALLRRAFRGGGDLAAAAAELGRSPRACESRAFRLGLRRGGGWTAEEDGLLRELCARGVGWESIALALNCSDYRARCRAAELGIRKEPAQAAGAPPWTAEEDARLRAMCAGRMGWASIAEGLGRPVKACRRRAAELGIEKPATGAWTAEDDGLLRDMWTGPASAAWCASELGRTAGAVKARARGLGLTDGWAIEEEARLAELWPSAPMAEVVEECGHTAQQCMAKARSLGVRRPADHGQRDRRAARRTSDPAPVRTGAPAARAGLAWDWKEGRYIARHRDEPVAALAAELGRTEDEVSEIMAAMDAAERRGTC